MDISQSTHPPVAQVFPNNGNRAAVLMLLMAAFLWGSGNVANKTVLQDMDPFAAATARNLVAFVALVPFALREILRVNDFVGWAKSAMLPSALFAVAIIVQQWGYQSATVTNASFLVNTACVLTPIIAFFVLREQISPCLALATLLTAVGIFLMSGAGRSLAEMNVGDVACLVSALFYAGWMVALSRHATTHGRPVATTCLHCLLTVVSAAGVLFFLVPSQPGSWGGAVPEVLYLGVFSTAAAFALTAAAQARVTASTAAVLVAAESLFGAIGAMLMLGERPGPQVAMGAGLILFAILIVACRPAQQVRKRPIISHRPICVDRAPSAGAKPSRADCIGPTVEIAKELDATSGKTVTIGLSVEITSFRS